MLIENEIKLDYKDVLFRPKRSTLTSRQQVDLFRTIDFVNAKGQDRRFYGIPIIASNMDGVGTFEMATELRKSGLMTCLVKTYTQNALVEYFDSDSEAVLNYTIISIGATEEDLKKLRNVYEITDGKVKYICVLL